MAENKPNEPAAPSAPKAPPARVRPSAAKTAAPARQWYQIAHGGVGQWAQGQIITSDDLVNIDVDRLLSLGAIQEITEPIDVPSTAAQDEDAPVGPDGE
jgi:hypothetical protein